MPIDNKQKSEHQIADRSVPAEEIRFSSASVPSASEQRGSHRCHESGHQSRQARLHFTVPGRHHVQSPRTGRPSRHTTPVSKSRASRHFAEHSVTAPFSAGPEVQIEPTPAAHNSPRHTVPTVAGADSRLGWTSSGPAGRAVGLGGGAAGRAGAEQLTTAASATSRRPTARTEPQNAPQRPTLKQTQRLASAIRQQTTALCRG